MLQIQLPNGDFVAVWLEDTGFSMTIQIRQPVRMSSIKGNTSTLYCKYDF